MSDRDHDVPHVHVTGADGSRPVQLTSGPAADFDPAWSPDGRRIVFQSDRDGNPEIYAMPDGRIVVTSTRDGDYALYRMNPDGSELVRLSQQVGMGRRSARVR